MREINSYGRNESCTMQRSRQKWTVFGQSQRSTGQNMNGSKGRNQTSADKDNETVPFLSGRTDWQRTVFFIKFGKNPDSGQNREGKNPDRFRRADRHRTRLSGKLKQKQDKDRTRSVLSADVWTTLNRQYKKFKSTVQETKIGPAKRTSAQEFRHQVLTSAHYFFMVPKFTLQSNLVPTSTAWCRSYSCRTSIASKWTVLVPKINDQKSRNWRLKRLNVNVLKEWRYMDPKWKKVDSLLNQKLTAFLIKMDGK